jgi:hypothetical protein
MAAKPTRFVTLTVRPTPGLSAEEELDRMNAAWRNMWKRLKRLYGDRAQGYVRVVELHKSGTPHLHLALAIPFLPQTTLSRWWQEFTSSPIVDIRAIKTERGLAQYLSKYLTKDTAALDGRRKWSQSRAFLPAVEKKPLDPEQIPVVFAWSSAKLENFEAALAEAGWVSTHGLWLAPNAAFTG